jgi:transposase
MQKRSIWLRLLGIQGATFSGVEMEGRGICVSVVLHGAESGRCPECQRHWGGYDHPAEPSVWRGIPFGLVRVEIRCQLKRVRCPLHGVLLESVPWARRGSGYTRAFEDMTAWLATKTDKTSVSRFMHIAWPTVGSILQRVAAEGASLRGPLKPTRIGIDEVSYRKGHYYLTVVVDHDTGLLLFASPGKNSESLRPFFDSLGPQGRAGISLVSMDAAPAFKAAIKEHCPNARICMDPFHVVQWMTRGLDDIRRRLWRSIREAGGSGAELKFIRFAVLKNRDDLDEAEENILTRLQRINAPLYSAYLLKEQLRQVFKLKGKEGLDLLDSWLASARASAIHEIQKVARAITENLTNIRLTLEYGLSNARTESLNNRIKLLTRLAYGFHSAAPLIALALLKLGGLCPDLPFENPTHSV